MNYYPICANKSINLMDIIIPVGTTIFSVIVGGFIGYLSARRISTLNAKQIACANLRKDFSIILAKINLIKNTITNPITNNAEILDVRCNHPSIDMDIISFLKNTLIDHAHAIEEFRFFVPKNKTTAYQEAWNKYCYTVRNCGLDSNGNLKNRNEFYNDFENLIHGILQFADNKENFENNIIKFIKEIIN